MKPFGVRIAFALCAAFVASQAHASVLFTFSEVGSDILLTGAGSLNVDGLPRIDSTTIPIQVRAAEAQILIGPSGSSTFDTISVITPATAFGTGIGKPGAGTGQAFGFVGGDAYLLVPAGYVSGDPLSGTSLLLGKTFASFGLTPGTYDFSYDIGGEVADRIVVQIGPVAVASVPEPAPIALFGIGLIAFVSTTRRRRVHWPEAT